MTHRPEPQVHDAAGAADFPLVLPTPFAPLDFFIQCGVADGATFLVSNPLNMHAQ